MISDWSDLQVIMSIASETTLSGAARRLGVNQSTISRRLQAIEKTVNRPVFLRRADGRFEPSQTGLDLLEAALKMKDTLDGANARITAATVPVKVASCEVLASRFVAPALSSWSAQTGLTGDLAVHDDLFDLPEGSFDVLFSPMESAPDDMIGRKIGVLEWKLYAAPSYLAHAQIDKDTNSLSGQKVIHASGSLARVQAFQWLANLGGTVAFSASSVMTQRDMAESGLGIALLPSTILGPQTGLVPVETGLVPPVGEVWMVARRTLARQPRIRSFLDWAYDFFDGQASPAKALK